MSCCSPPSSTRHTALSTWLTGSAVGLEPQLCGVLLFRSLHEPPQASSLIVGITPYAFRNSDHGLEFRSCQESHEALSPHLVAGPWTSAGAAVVFKSFGAKAVTTPLTIK